MKTSKLFIKTKKETLYKIILLVFLCALYVQSNYRPVFEVIFYIVFLFYFIKNKKKPTKYIFWNIFFVGICTLSILWSHNTQQTIIEARIMLQGAIIGNLLIAFINTKQKLIDIYKYLVVAGMALIIQLIYTFPLENWLKGRLGSNALGLNANMIGLYLSISAICAMYLGKYENKKKYYLISSVFSLVIMLTGSKKAFIMLTMGIVILIYLNSTSLNKKIKWFLLSIIILLIGYIVVMKVPVFYNIMGNRLEKMINAFIGSGNTDYSSLVRLEMIRVGKEIFKSKPFLGYGIGSYSIISGFGMYSHNNYIELLVGLGLIGLFTYYGMYIYITIKLFKGRKATYGNPLLAIMIMTMIMDYGLVSYNGLVYQVIIALSFAASILLKQKKVLITERGSV